MLKDKLQVVTSVSRAVEMGTTGTMIKKALVFTCVENETCAQRRFSYLWKIETNI